MPIATQYVCAALKLCPFVKNISATVPHSAENEVLEDLNKFRTIPRRSSWKRMHVRTSQHYPQEASKVKFGSQKKMRFTC